MIDRDREDTSELVYEGPEEKTEAEIRATLARTDILVEARIRAVLSALYYGQTTQFAGDILLEEFKTAETAEKQYLKNLFETFHEMHRTVYRIRESIALLEGFKHDAPEHAIQTEAVIETLIEFERMFSLKP